MSFLDAFKSDMRRLKRIKASWYEKNAQWETVAVSEVTNYIKGVFYPIWYKDRNNRNGSLRQEIEKTEATHILYYDHSSYALNYKDEVLAEDWTRCNVVWIYPIYEFWAKHDCNVALLLRIT